MQRLAAQALASGVTVREAFAAHVPAPTAAAVGAGDIDDVRHSLAAPASGTRKRQHARDKRSNDLKLDQGDRAHRTLRSGVSRRWVLRALGAGAAGGILARWGDEVRADECPAATPEENLAVVRRFF